MRLSAPSCCAQSVHAAVTGLAAPWPLTPLTPGCRRHGEARLHLRLVLQIPEPGNEAVRTGRVCRRAAGPVQPGQAGPAKSPSGPQAGGHWASCLRLRQEATVLPRDVRQCQTRATQGQRHESDHKVRRRFYPTWTWPARPSKLGRARGEQCTRKPQRSSDFRLRWMLTGRPRRGRPQNSELAGKVTQKPEWSCLQDHSAASFCPHV